MTTKRMGEEGLRWFVGTVEDINDPEKLGRVRVRVINEHDDPSIQSEDLNWATILTPTTSASYQQIGRSPTGLLVGSHVFGFFLDGHEKQLPIIWGSYAKMPDGTQNTNDVPALAREINNLNIPQIGPEPPSAYNAKYPYNHVWQTQSGHIIEVDDTPAQERIRVYHRSGSYIEINNAGRTVQKTVDSQFNIVVVDKTEYVGGSLNLQVMGSANVSIQGDVNMTVGGKVTASASEWDITGNMNVTGNITASGDVVGNNISLDNHIHSDPQGGVTGPPQ